MSSLALVSRLHFSFLAIHHLFHFLERLPLGMFVMLILVLDVDRVVTSLQSRALCEGERCPSASS
jgi:hypothetical protein